MDSNNTKDSLDKQVDHIQRLKKKAITAATVFLTSFFGETACIPTYEHDTAQVRTAISVDEQRESIFDHKVNLEDLVLEIPRIPRFCDQTDNLTKQRVDIGDCKLYVEQEGEGTPIVLLHGGPGGTHHGFHPHFSKAKEFAKVIYYDQRGCGLSDRKKGSGYSLEQAVNDLENLRKSLKIDKWVVLGYSYGGLLAQCYAKTHPESLKGLILVCSLLTTPEKLNPSRQSDFLSEQEKAKIREIYRNKEFSIAQKVYNAFLNGYWKRQSYYRPSKERIAQIALYGWDHDQEFRDRICQEIDNIDLKGVFDPCPIPTMIIEGKWDLTWNTDKIEVFYQNHPNARLEIFEHSSHSPFEDQPEEFFEKLYFFVHNLSDIPQSEISKYQAYLSEWASKNYIEHMVRSTDHSSKSYQRIVEAYSEEWIQRFEDPSLLLSTGFALYDFKRYQEALSVFQKMEELSRDFIPFYATSLIWQAHMLDILEHREKAVSIYQQVKDMDLRPFMEHSQFDGMELSSEYAAKRIEEPFQRVEVNE